MKLVTTCGRWLGLFFLLACLVSTASAQRTVTLQLNTATLPDTTQIESLIEVRGCLDGCTDDMSDLPGDDIIAWNDNTTLEPMNEGGDYWEVSFQIPEDEQLAFKFYSQQAEDPDGDPNTNDGIGGWEDGDNHIIEAGQGDVDLGLHYFVKGDGRAYDWRPWESKEDSVAVWFRVFMNTENAVVKGYDSESSDMVIGLRGSPDNGGTGATGEMIDWGGAVPLMRESDDDTRPGYHLYSGVMYFPETAIGNSQTFKYYIDGLGLADGGYEDGNDRSFTIPAQDTTLHWVYFSNSPPVDPSAERVTANVLFNVDVRPLEDVGLFDRVRGDTVIVRGGFNGFGNCLDADPDACTLFEQLDGTFGSAIPVSDFVGNEIAYKFYIDFEGVEDPPEGWEEPLGQEAGGNRFFTFTGNDNQDLGQHFFNNIRPGNVIPDGTEIEVTFQVDMTPALTFNTKPAFDPATDEVQALFEDPLWIRTQTNAKGVEELDDVVLTDDDGDMIYTGTYTLVGPTYNGIGYRYQYGTEAAGFTVEGDGGFDAGRRRYQYVLPNSDGSWPAAFTLNQVTIIESGAMPFEDNPTATGIEVINDEIPDRIALGQNYPNPFNPSTTFEYTIDRTQHVTIRIYDLLGRVVTTLVDGTQPAATYKVTFDASRLASGVYLYQIETPTKAISKRMVLLK